MSRNGSLKVLDYAMSGPDGKDNCNKFVDILGLRTIFPLFMKTPTKNRKKVLSAEQHEGMLIFINNFYAYYLKFLFLEHVVSIIASMLRNCKGSQRARLISKFSESDHEKVDRLMELHFKYLEKVEEIDGIIEQEDKVSVYLNTQTNTLFVINFVGFFRVKMMMKLFI